MTKTYEQMTAERVRITPRTCQHCGDKLDTLAWNDYPREWEYWSATASTVNVCRKNPPSNAHQPSTPEHMWATEEAVHAAVIAGEPFDALCALAEYARDAFDAR